LGLALLANTRPQVDYPAACNAAETLLLHQSIVTSLWPSIAHELASRSVTLLCDDVSIRALTKASQTWSPEFAKHIAEAIPESFDTEHLSLTISVKVVESIEEAINHVNTHGSHHTDCIVTENQDNAKKWCSGIDSAGTFVNASTRFADGFRYGFGTEVY
jgi:glutamate-5-semialdehyde dehydrogenase